MKKKIALLMCFISIFMMSSVSAIAKESPEKFSNLTEDELAPYFELAKEYIYIPII